MSNAETVRMRVSLSTIVTSPRNRHLNTAPVPATEVAMKEDALAVTEAPNF